MEGSISSAEVSLELNSRTKKFSDQEWLNARLRQYNIASTLENFDAASELDTSTEGIQNQMADACKSLDDAVTEKELQEIMLHSMQLSEPLTDILFPQDSAHEPTPQQQEIKKLVTRVMELERDLLHIYADIEPLDLEVSQLKQDNRELLESNRMLASRVSDLKKEKEQQMATNCRSPQYIELRNSNDLIIKKLDLIQNCFQGLILGCGVRWTEDNGLMALIESLGKALDCAHDTTELFH